MNGKRLIQSRNAQYCKSNACATRNACSIRCWTPRASRWSPTRLGPAHLLDTRHKKGWPDLRGSNHQKRNRVHPEAPTRRPGTLGSRVTHATARRMGRPRGRKSLVFGPTLRRIRSQSILTARTAWRHGTNTTEEEITVRKKTTTSPLETQIACGTIMWFML